jgi:hypothetical protein
LGVTQAIENRPRLRPTLGAVNDRYLEVQQEVLETFGDRGHRQRLPEPPVTPVGRRTPGLRLNAPRLLGVLQALVGFAYLAQGGRFRTADLHARAVAALGQTVATYTLAPLRDDLSKLRGKGLVVRIPRTQAYPLTSAGYRLGVRLLKRFHRIYAPLTAAVCEPVPADAHLPDERRAQLDRLYAAVNRALNDLFAQVGIKLAG